METYWVDDDGLATIEYSVMLMLMPVAAATRAGELGNLVAEVVDEAIALFE